MCFAFGTLKLGDRIQTIPFQNSLQGLPGPSVPWDRSSGHFFFSVVAIVRGGDP